MTYRASNLDWKRSLTKPTADVLSTSDALGPIPSQ
jgi:hypothetical protein